MYRVFLEIVQIEQWFPNKNLRTDEKKRSLYFHKPVPGFRVPHDRRFFALSRFESLHNATDDKILPCLQIEIPAWPYTYVGIYTRTCTRRSSSLV